MKKLLVLAIVSSLAFGCQKGGSTANSDIAARETELAAKEQAMIQQQKDNLVQKEAELKAKEEALNKSTQTGENKGSQPPPRTSTTNDTKPTNTTYQKAVKYTAVINDPDGYTNVRNQPNGNAPIIDKIYDGDKFTVEMVDANWWKATTTSNVKGYIHKSRVQIIGKK